MSARKLRKSQPKGAKPGEPYKLYPAERFKPLDPDKPLAPYRVPALKPFDRDMPGQGMLDFTQDGPVVVYPDDDGARRV
jgi:hypothetical protein